MAPNNLKVSLKMILAVVLICASKLNASKECHCGLELDYP